MNLFEPGLVDVGVGVGRVVVDVIVLVAVLDVVVFVVCVGMGVDALDGVLVLVGVRGLVVVVGGHDRSLGLGWVLLVGPERAPSGRSAARWSTWCRASERDPDNADYYAANYKKFSALIDGFDKAMRKSFATIPERKLLTYHDAYA